jgi:5-methylthioadenosine/S-adenosylhomocysteine deaminase
MDASGTIARGDLLARDGLIVALGQDVPAALAALPGGRVDESVDASDGFVLPGFVQGHLHLCQTLFRGCAEQSDLLRWLRESIWPLEAAHTERSIAAAARLGLVELIAGGVTCINDMGTVRHGDAVAAVLEQSGIRATFGKALMDAGRGVPPALREETDEALESALALARRWHGAAGGRLRVSLAPRFILSCSDRLWRDVAAAAAERGLIIHTHLAESPTEAREVEGIVASTAARYFERRGVLSERFVGAHGVWVDDEELALLARADAALVHCPGSNLKLGSGFANLRRWARAGLRRGIGSDGAACDNRLDTFHELSLAALITRALEPEDHLGARDVLALATCDGARALGLGDVTGALEPGRQADVIVVDHSAPHLAPHETADPYVTLVHAARATDVRLTMVAGRILYRDGECTTLDPGRVTAEARVEARALLERAGRGPAQG